MIVSRRRKWKFCAEGYADSHLSTQNTEIIVDYRKTKWRQDRPRETGWKNRQRGKQIVTLIENVHILCIKYKNTYLNTYRIKRQYAITYGATFSFSSAFTFNIISYHRVHSIRFKCKMKRINIINAIKNTFCNKIHMKNLYFTSFLLLSIVAVVYCYYSSNTMLTKYQPTTSKLIARSLLILYTFTVLINGIIIMNVSCVVCRCLQNVNLYIE